jgi:glutamyl-tRNA synthetase
MPDALRNYLLRLGWSFEDKEIFTLDESIKYFNLDGIGKSPSKLDMSRILSMNEYYIKNIDESELYKYFVEYCQIYKEKINPEKEVKIKLSLSFLKNKAKTLEDIYNNAKYLISDEIKFKEEDLNLIDEKAKKIIKEFKDNLVKMDNLNKESLEPVVSKLITNYETNFKGVGQPLRIALTGSKFGPGLYDIVISLGKEEVEKRLKSKILI